MFPQNCFLYLFPPFDWSKSRLNCHDLLIYLQNQFPYNSLSRSQPLSFSLSFCLLPFLFLSLFPLKRCLSAFILLTTKVVWIVTSTYTYAFICLYKFLRSPSAPSSLSHLCILHPLVYIVPYLPTYLPTMSLCRSSFGTYLPIIIHLCLCTRN